MNSPAIDGVPEAPVSATDTVKSSSGAERQAPAEVTPPVCLTFNTTVSAESVALHRGRTTMVWQTTLRNEAGKLCSVVTQTQLVLD